MDKNNFPPMPSRYSSPPPVAGDGNASPAAAPDPAAAPAPVPDAPAPAAQQPEPGNPPGSPVAPPQEPTPAPAAEPVSPPPAPDQGLKFSDVIGDGSVPPPDAPKIEFANDFVREMNDFFSKGGTNDEFKR
jgi:hypothetical protein